MNVQQIQDILRRFGTGECTAAEKELIDKWYSELVNTGEVPWDMERRTMMQATLENRLLQSITNEPPQALPTGRVRFMQRKFWWAAAIFVLLAGSAYFFFNKAGKEKETAVAKTKTQQNDVAPGGNKAVLTLANGTTISLNDAANGMLAQQGSTNVVKSRDGSIEYSPSTGGGRGEASTIGYNSLSTPKGGQYQLVLPDGSKVWLNAASSITYPTAFTGSQRKVKITGEVYFEVAHNSRMPFIVEKGSLAVEVLGTHFNINAYDDEDAMKTTLLEGKVKTSMVNGEWSILKPGQQAVMHNSRFTIHDNVDLEAIMAWKNGLFHFENADIKAVMRQLARWYDVDVVYKNPAAKSDPLFIDMSRNANLSDVLKALELSGSARFHIEGKKIIVL
jgi:ferric-dicitrate binding protein FerR (iron transport regulator)